MSEHDQSGRIDYFLELKRHPENSNNPKVQRAIDRAEYILRQARVRGMVFVENPEIAPEQTTSYNFADAIRGVRLARVITQKELAAIAGVSPGYIGMIETDRIPNPGARRVAAIETALGLEEGELTKLAATNTKTPLKS